MPRGRRKGVKDSPGVVRRKLLYFKKYNPKRSNGRPKGRPNKSDNWAFYLWRKGHKLLGEPESLQLWKRYYEWLLASVSGKRGRKFRSSQSLIFDTILEGCLFGEGGEYRHCCNCYGRSNTYVRSHFVSKEEGFRHMQELKRLRWKRQLSILRKIRRLKKAIAQEQINQGSFGQETNK